MDPNMSCGIGHGSSAETLMMVMLAFWGLKANKRRLKNAMREMYQKVNAKRPR